MEDTPLAVGTMTPKKNVLFEVTPVSKALAAVLFIILPFAGFWVGLNYNNGEVIQEGNTPPTHSNNIKSGNAPINDTPITTVDSAPSASEDNIAEIIVHFNQGNNGQYANPAIGGDSLFISADENIEGSELSGWSVKSMVSGKQFFLKDVSQFNIGPSEWGIFVHTAKDPNYTDRAMGGEIHMYFDEPTMAWGAKHDTIQLLSATGVVVDTITY